MSAVAASSVSPTRAAPPDRRRAGRQRVRRSRHRRRGRVRQPPPGRRTHPAGDRAVRRLGQRHLHVARGLCPHRDRSTSGFCPSATRFAPLILPVDRRKRLVPELLVRQAPAEVLAGPQLEADPCRRARTARRGTTPSTRRAPPPPRSPSSRSTAGPVGRTERTVRRAVRRRRQRHRHPPPSSAAATVIVQRRFSLCVTRSARVTDTFGRRPRSCPRALPLPAPSSTPTPSGRGPTVSSTARSPPPRAAPDGRGSPPTRSATRSPPNCAAQGPMWPTSTTYGHTRPETTMIHMSPEREEAPCGARTAPPRRRSAHTLPGWPSPAPVWCGRLGRTAHD